MADKNCSACQELMNDAPNLVVKGLGSTEVSSLKNNTGLNPSSGNDDCTDLNNMNDCLIGNLESEVDSYDVCEWKEFTKNFVNNTWAVLKGIIAAICGLWTNIKNILTRLAKVECEIGKLSGEKEFLIDGLRNADLGSGVEWRTSGSRDVYPSLKGNACVLQITGSLKFTGSKWLNKTGTVDGNTDDGNWLVYRYKIKKSDYGIKKMWSSTLQTYNGGAMLASAHVYNTGEQTPGQWGYDDPNGAVTVPDGYIYLDIRVSQIFTWGITGNNGNITFTGVIPILTDTDAGC